MIDELDPNYCPVLSFGNEVQPESLNWLWPGRIPLGKLTLLIGDPGVGKSLLAADLAAHVTTGKAWPDVAAAGGGAEARMAEAGESSASPLQEAQICAHGADSPTGDGRHGGHLVAGDGRHGGRPLHSAAGDGRAATPGQHWGGVIFVSPEEGAADVLLPRLVAAGADVERVCIVNGVRRHPKDEEVVPLTLPAHTELLAQAIWAVTWPRLVILDPLNVLLAGGVQGGPGGPDTTLAALAEIANRYSVAIVAVGHLVKARTLRVLYRVRGSLGLVAAARAVHLLTADGERPERRILSPLKAVYGPLAPPVVFRIVEGPRLEWEKAGAAGAVAGEGGCGADCTSAAAVELLDLSVDARSALSEACDWLAGYLAGGPRAARDIFREARAAGLSGATMRRAKRLLGVRSLRPAADSAWMWSRG